ncbi:MAG: 5'-methylthioadenosine nucleosidase [Planctomycetes bacterium]|nr:5'-methylthioadenosine nucleosidase [Planctomycetota bacterium]
MNATDVTSVDVASADIGIVCSLPLEISPFLNRCQRVKSYSGGPFKFVGGLYDGIRVAIVEAGTGPVRAQRATRSLLDAHKPPWVISTGFAGALRADLKVGNIVVSNELVGLKIEPLKIDLAMAANPAKGLHVGRTLTVDRMVRTIADKQALATETGAIAVDMESIAVASVCRETKTRFMSVRAISDDMSTDLPPEVLSLIGETGAVRLGAVIGSLWKRPSSYKDMWRMREHAMEAADRLADFLDGIVIQLYRARSGG